MHLDEYSMSPDQKRRFEALVKAQIERRGLLTIVDIIQLKKAFLRKEQEQNETD